MQEVPEDKVLDTSPERRNVGAKTADDSAQANGYNTPPRTPPMQDRTLDDFDDSPAEESRIEEPVVHSVQTVQPTSAAQVISKAKIVNVPKRIPPKLPARNPNRSGPIVVDASPKDSSDGETFSTEAKHDSAHEVGIEKDASVDLINEKMDDVRLADDADDEDERPSPWAKVEEARKQEAEHTATTAGTST